MTYMTWCRAACQEKSSRGSHPSGGRAVTNSRKTYRNLVLNTTINRHAGYLQLHLARLPGLGRFSCPSLRRNSHKQVVNSLTGRCVYYRSSSAAHYVGFSPGGGIYTQWSHCQGSSLCMAGGVFGHTHTHKTLHTPALIILFFPISLRTVQSTH